MVDLNILFSPVVLEDGGEQFKTTPAHVHTTDPVPAHHPQEHQTDLTFTMVSKISDLDLSFGKYSAN